jgi:ribosome recycling factor
MALSYTVGIYLCLTKDVAPMLTIEDVIKTTEEKMNKAIAATQNELASLRTGRANPMMLDRVSVDYYGTPTSIRQMANVSVQEGQTLVIQPYDKTQLAEIEKAIAKSDLGLTPNNDGSVIRLNVPALTQDRRKELVKTAHKYGEEGKVAIRNVRRESMEHIDKLKKTENLPEDDVKRHQEKIQKMTDNHISKLEVVISEKEKEVLEF